MTWKVSKATKVHFWEKAECEPFKMNLMMSVSQKSKMFLLRRVNTYWTRNIENEIGNVSIKKYIDVLDVFLRIFSLLSIIPNIKNTPFLFYLRLKLSDAQRKYLKLKDRKLNNFTKMCLFSRTVQLCSLVSLMFSSVHILWF